MRVARLSYAGPAFHTSGRRRNVPEPPNELHTLKAKLRALAEGRRLRQPDKDQLSRVIRERFTAIAEYAACNTLLGYVHFRNEVRTRHFLRDALEQDKRIVVPYCVGNELELFLLESMDELTPGTLGILEPKPELRSIARKKIDVAEVDLIMVPGVAFDARGGRLGHGKGFYDRLLARTRPGTSAVAVAFECQLFPHVPMGPHDVPIDKLITEKAVYRA